jgi:hypothetical protein
MGSRADLDRCGKSRLLPVFDPKTVQPVARRYTDYVTRPTRYDVITNLFSMKIAKGTTYGDLRRWLLAIIHHCKRS